MRLGGRISLGVLVLVAAAPASPQARDYSITRIADSTNLPRVFPANSADRASLNRGGAVAFYAGDGIYVGDGSSLVTRARITSADPTSQFSALGTPSINDNGDLGFYCYGRPAGAAVRLRGRPKTVAARMARRADQACGSMPDAMRPR